MVSKWEKHGTVHHVKGSAGRPTSRRNSENISKVREAFEECPELSLRRGAAVLDIPKTSLQRLLKEDLGFRPYKLIEGHNIPPKSLAERVTDSKELLNAIVSKPQILDNLWFSDEAHFELTPPRNPQNIRNWCAEHPNVVVERIAHPQRTTAWAAISSKSNNLLASFLSFSQQYLFFQKYFWPSSTAQLTLSFTSWKNNSFLFYDNVVNCGKHISCKMARLHIVQIRLWISCERTLEIGLSPKSLRRIMIVAFPGRHILPIWTHATSFCGDY